MKTRDTVGLEGTKSSLQNSQTLLNKLDYNSSPTANQLSASDSLVHDDIPSLSTSSYPYLIPRNQGVFAQEISIFLSASTPDSSPDRYSEKKSSRQESASNKNQQ